MIKRFYSIDFLRAIAILGVVFHHAPFSNRLSAADVKQILLPRFVEAVLYFGKYGVQLFLVISGFSIHMFWATYANQNEKIGFKSFWKKRLIRLYPPYLITLILTLICAWFFHGLMSPKTDQPFFQNFGFQNLTEFSWGISSLFLMFQNITNAGGVIGNGPLWSLALEEQLYLLYFPLLFLRRRSWMLALSVTGIIAIGAMIVGMLRDPVEFDWWFTAPPIYWFGWALGALAAEAAIGKIRLPKIMRAPFFLFSVSAVAIFSDLPKDMFQQTFLYPLRGVAHCVAFFIMINWLIQCDKNFERFKVLRLIGTACFGIYLVHVPAMVAVKQILLRLQAPLYLIFSARIVFSVIAGLLFYICVERYFHRKAKQETQYLKT